MITRRTHVALLAASLLLTGCGGGAVASTESMPAPSREPSPTTPSPEISVEVAPQQIPGVGPRTWAKVPADARQAVVVTGRGRDSSASTVVLYERTEAGWRAGASWPAHNALKGWTDHHTAGDLRSPIGVYTLTDAGGLLKNPGTKLSYDRGSGFTAPGTGFEGEPLAGSFDYVIAINYNRRPGTSPLDWTRPLGAGRGGGIWLHVDHGGPTHGCVSIAEKHMKELLLTLDQALRPVVVMGDAKSLNR
ncbi:MULTISPECIES: L,D-transpeptidase family protein [unclassified Streptomyces]|uniref:L,D-transpeptidase family protein n=1 Tax=unclassified Streptomyces TaxID=2593676 RepID=UPI0024770EB9|nr:MULTISPECIES: L,D-transpeptidase family protein [unclassified Streptomyces]MDH6456181.1 L,D-peptidoglycan transpeptidase YkuD (ErfK/YbiS/YcfS/YnhG family) [Streptomyces sp. SAI-119]MDH6501890.1 L,D-peptidoglycan transpeptidase YkuD (ErfK/YbiS/YcfS/YnhG family) [Streptomyces sp. SAI-149]